MKRFLFASIITLFFFSACENTGSQLSINTNIFNIEQKIQDYYFDSQYDSMIFATNELLAMLHADSFAVKRGNTFVQKGVAMSIIGDYDSATYCLYEGLKLGEANDNSLLIRMALCNIGVLYFDLKKLDDAIATYERWLIYAREYNDSIEISKALNNIGNAYMTIATDFEKAAPYLQECVEISKACGYTEGEYVAALNLAECYIDLDKLDEAQQTISLVKENMAGNYYADYAQAKIYHKTKKYDEAIVILEDMLKMNLNTRQLYLTIMTEISQIHEEKGDLRSALDYRIKYQIERDSLHTVESEKIVQEMKISYETEKKDIQITALAKEKRLLSGLIIACGVLVVLSLAILLYRNRLQRKQRQLFAAQVALESETAERSRLAKDLHDGLGGMLSLVKINLNDMKGLKVMEHSDAEHFSKAIDMLDNSITELRRVAHHIMPESLVRSGLKTSLEDFAAAVPNAEFHFFGQENRLETNLEITLYRSVHELVNNVLKHASATHIDIQLVQESDRISLTVSDNGKGFDTTQTTGGIGLQNIRNRIAVYNGEMHIYSNQKSGTEINIEIPLKN